MSARFVEVAEALKQALVAEFSQEGDPTVVRTYTPRVERPAIVEAVVFVVPQAISVAERVSRSGRLHTYRIDIAIAVPIERADEIASTDEATELVDRILGMLEADGIDGVGFDEAEIPVLYDQGEIDGFLFLTKITAAFSEQIGGGA